MSLRGTLIFGGSANSWAVGIVNYIFLFSFWSSLRKLKSSSYDSSRSGTLFYELEEDDGVVVVVEDPPIFLINLYIKSYNLINGY